MKEQKRPFQFRYSRLLILLTHVVDELAADCERSPRQKNGRASFPFDLRQRLRIELRKHVGYVEGSGYRRYRAYSGKRAGGRDDRRATQAVTDQQRRLHSGVRHAARRRDEILHVVAEARPCEIPVASPKPRKVEAEHADAGTGQPPRNPHCRHVVLSTGETVSEQSPCPGRPGRKLNASGKPMTGGILKIERARRHGMLLV